MKFVFKSTTVEKALEKKLHSEVKKLGGLAIKFFCPFFTGLPDRIVLMQGAKIWFAEIKTSGKKPTARQLFVHGLLKKLGFEVWVIDTEILLQNFLKKIQE